MKKLFRKIVVLLLCVTLLFGDDAKQVFAGEIDIISNEESKNGKKSESEIITTPVRIEENSDINDTEIWDGVYDLDDIDNEENLEESNNDRAAKEFTIHTENELTAVQETKIDETVTDELRLEAAFDSAISWGISKIGSQEYTGYCQAFVWACYNEAGIDIGSFASARDCKNALMTNTDINAPRGALVFFDITQGSAMPYGHVGISLGDGTMIHAGHKGVEIISFTDPGYLSSWYWIRYCGWAIPEGAGGTSPNENPYGRKTIYLNGKTWEYDFNWSREVIIYGCTPEPQGTLVIPDTINGFPVTEIGHMAFYNCTNLTGVVFPSELTTIGFAAFENCNFQGSLTIPDSVTEIGHGAFQDAGFTGDLIIGNSVEKIDDMAFFCTGFTGELILPNSLRTIGSGAFEGTPFSGELNLPYGLETIGEDAFFDTKFTGDIVIPDTVKSIGIMAIYSTLRYPWEDNYADRRLKLGRGLTRIEDYNFTSDWLTGKLVLPDGLTYIGNTCFVNNEFEGEVVIPYDVTYIGERAFFNCPNITDYYLSERVMEIGAGAFSDESVWDSDKQEFTEFNTPTATFHCALDSYAYQTLAERGAKVVAWDYESMVYKKTSSNNLEYTINADGKTCTLHGPIDYPEGTVIIPEKVNGLTVTGIEDGALAECYGITGIRLPSTLKSIGISAFYSCSGITGTVKIPSSVTSIGKDAFKLCNGVEIFENPSSANITLPSKEGFVWVDKNKNVIKSIKNGTATKCVARESKPGSFLKFNGTGGYSYDIPVDWNAFVRPSTEYDSKMAALALTLSSSAEEGQGKVEGDLENLGFSVDSGNYNSALTINSPAYTFGYLPVSIGGKKKNIFVIVIRGTSTPGDIITDVIASPFVYPINDGADFIAYQFKEFVESKLNISYDDITSSDNILLITGHSLGGAMANRLAYKDDLVGFTPLERRYVYTFAAFRPFSKIVQELGVKKEYLNVHNIINTADFVTYHPSSIEYRRIGKDYCFDWDDTAVKKAYKSITGKNSYPTGTWGPHNTSVYLASILSGTKYSAERDTIRKITYISWKCPVDVEILDSNGDNICKVENNNVVSEGNENVFMYAVGDEKYAIIIGDEDYDFKMTGTDNGTMEYSLTTVDSVTGEIIDEKTYSNVALNDGREFESDIEEGKASQVNLFALDDDGESVKIINTDGTEDLLADGYTVLLDKQQYSYNGGKIEPQIRVFDGFKELIQGKDYSVKYENNINANDGTNAKKAPAVVIKGLGNYKQTIRKTFVIEPQSIGDGTVFDGRFTISIADKQYNGKTQQSKPSIQYGKKTLKENKDYTLSFAPDKPSEQGVVTVTVTAKEGGNFTGSAQVNYRIFDKGKALTSAFVSSINSVQYTGKEINVDDISLDVKLNKKSEESLVRGVDYTVSYAPNSNIVNVGTVSLIITGIGQYAGSKKTSFKITPKPLSPDMISVEDAIYSGKAQQPLVTVRCDDTIVEATNYTLKYKNNVASAAYDQVNNIGKSTAPTVTIKGKGNYSGSVKKNFTISARPLSAKDLDVFISDMKDNGKYIAPASLKSTLKINNEKIILKRNKDYTLDYVWNPLQEKQTASISLMGNYANDGEIISSFKIFKPAQLNISDYKVTLLDNDIKYTGVKITPALKIEDKEHNILEEGRDYTVSYSNNINAALASDKKAPKWTVKGKGKYSGSISGTFTISPIVFDSANYRVIVSEMKYSGKALKPKVGVEQFDPESGATINIVPAKEYTLEYDNNISVCEPNESQTANNPTVYVHGKGNYKDVSNYKNNSHCLKCCFRIYQVDVSSLCFDVSAQEYSGIQLKPEIKVYADKKKTVKLTEGTDYVLEYGENIKAGSGSVIVKGIGNYGGSKTVKFTIVPKWLQWLLL